MGDYLRENGSLCYVLGIVFVGDDKILLQLKNRGNKYIIGKYNGLGGKQEMHETPYESMNREFVEETGWKGSLDWYHMATLRYQNAILEVLYTTIYDPEFLTFEFTSDDENMEELHFFDLKDLDSITMPNNLRSIIQLCWDAKHG